MAKPECIAYWKSLRLGDTLARLDDRTLDLVGGDEIRPPHGAGAKIIERPGASLYRITVPMVWLWQYFNPAETWRSFELRIQQFMVDLNAEQQYDPTIGTFSGPLVFVHNEITDIRTVDSVAYASTDEITTTTPHGFNAGDWILLLHSVGSGLQPRFELAQVGIITSTTTFETQLTAATWTNGDTIYWVWWAYRDAFLDGQFTISGNPGAERARIDIPINFKSMDDPVFGQ